ncbi:GMC oxidoreductase-domain-containing protein [Armillaria fumosa]|nr:GMC oxidoreductase-domain-containing protein [Armillaria fumosa]
MSTSAVNPTNSARSYSRSAYVDPLLSRSTLHVLADAPAPRINWDTSSSEIKAKRVVWQADTTDSEHAITVNKEVILSGGVVGSPHIMLLSGVGPSSVLKAAGIDVVLDLPGVGQNVQDHHFRRDHPNVLPVPQVEILLSLNAANTITIQATLQHPLSRGQITVNSTSAFDTPVIDPGYFSRWADRDILRAAFKLPIAQYLGTESSPGTSVSSDDALNTWMNDNVHTDYHPLGSMSMLPKSLGGVVEKYCLVYGTSNVRVVDASIFPMSMSSHTGSLTLA